MPKGRVGTIKEGSLDKRPKFYTKTVGNPSPIRLGKGKTLGTNVLQIVKVFERVGTFDDQGADIGFTETFTHSLKQFPIPFGFIKVWLGNEDDATEIHTLPHSDATGDTVFKIGNITKDTIQVTGSVSGGAGQGWQYRIKLRLFREI